MLICIYTRRWEWMYYKSNKFTKVFGSDLLGTGFCCNWKEQNNIVNCPFLETILIQLPQKGKWLFTSQVAWAFPMQLFFCFSGGVQHSCGWHASCSAIAYRSYYLFLATVLNVITPSKTVHRLISFLWRIIFGLQVKLQKWKFKLLWNKL